MNGNNSGGISNTFNSTKNALELRLQQRRPRQVLADQGIIPPLNSPVAHYGMVQKLDRARKEDFLNKAIQDRPDRKYLVDKHILEDTVVSSPIVANQKNLKKAKLVDDLNEKILFRPGVIELVEKNIIPADDVQEAIRDGQLVYKKIADFVDDDSSDSFSPEQPTAPPSVSPPVNFTLGCSEPITCNQMIDKVFVTGKKGSVGKSSLSFTQSSTHPYLNRQSSKGSKSNLISSSRSSGPRKKKEKPKLKNYKYHQYIPPGQGKSSEKSVPNIDQDSPYQRLLEQQQIFLQYQIIKQNEFAAGPHNNGGQRSCEHSSSTSSFNQQSLPPPPPLISQRKIKLEHSLSNGSKLTFSKLDEMKVSELKEELKSRGLKVTGTKEVLIERLKPHCSKSSENIFTTLPDLHGNDGIIRSSDKQPRQSTTNGCHSDQQVIKMINGHHGNHVDDCMTSSNTAMFARKMPSPEKAKFVPKQEKMFNLATWNANVKDSRVISNTQITPSSGGSKLDDKDKLLMLQQEQIQHLQSLLQFQEAKMNRMRSETPQQDVDQPQDVTGQTFMAQKVNQQPPVLINSTFKSNEVQTNMQISSEPVTSSCHDNQDIEKLFGLIDKPESHQQQQEMLPSNHVDYNQLPFETTQTSGSAFHDTNEISDLLLRTSGDVLMDTNSFPLKMTPDPLNHYSRPSTCSSVDSGVIFNPSHFSPASIDASSRNNIPINDRTSTSSLDDVTEQTLNSAGCYRQPSTSYQQQLIKASSQELLTSNSSSDYFNETNGLNWLDLPLTPQAPQNTNSTPLQPSSSHDLMTSSDIFDHLDCRSDPSMEWGGDWDCFLSGTDFNT